MKIISLNVLSNRSSIFILAGKRMETPEEYKERYDLILDELEKHMNEGVEVICLQEVTPEFEQQIRSFLKERTNGPRYWFVYVPNVFKQGVLVNIDKCSYRPIRNNFHTINKYHKIQTLLIHQHYPERVFYLANIHLSGDLTPQGTKDRQDILKAIIELFEKYGTVKKPIIIVGDFNDELKLITPEFKKYLASQFLEFHMGNKLPTSYHRYDFKPDPETQKLVYLGLAKDPWQTLDHMLYSKKAVKINSLKLKPAKGVKGIEVPYTHKIVKKEIVNLPNYDTWPTDHSMMIYDLDIARMVKKKSGSRKTSRKTSRKRSKSKSKSRSGKR